MSSPKSNELRSLDILQDIKDGTTNSVSLSASQRKLLVPLLMSEGQSTAEIALLLNVSDRTIERDKEAIRRENALSQDPEFANIFAGRLVDQAQSSIQRIHKFQKDNNCPPAVKIEGEKACFYIVNFLAERLQSIGYLPTAAKKLEADLTHHLENPLSLKEIQSETKRLQDIERSLSTNRTKKIKSKTLEKKDKKS